MVAELKPQLKNPLLEKVRIAFEQYIQDCARVNSSKFSEDDKTYFCGLADEKFRKSLIELDNYLPSVQK